MQRPLAVLTRVGLAGCAFAFAIGRATAQAALFEPGLRWQWAATAGTPWIPRSVAFDAAAELVYAGVAYQNPSVRLLSAAPQGGPFAWGSDANLSGAGSSLRVGLAPDGARGWTLAQYPAPDTSHRRTELAGYDFLAAAQAGAPTGSAYAPSWRVDLGVPTGGQALLATEAAPATVVAAVLQTAGSQGQAGVLLAWCDGASGVAVRTQSFAASALRGLAASADGARVLLALGTELRVLGADGSTLRHVVLSASTDAVALSADGRTLAYGVAGALVVERDNGGAWTIWRTLSAAPGELATRVALCADGASAALGWWHAASGTSLRFEGWDLAAPARLHELAQAGAVGALQNFPEAVAVTPSGRHFAYGAWGAAGAEPELWLLARESATPLFATSLPGSVHALALSIDGARVCVAHKSAHANQFATTGAVRLYDSGARDVQAVQPAELGGTLALQARRSGASACVFALGAPGAGLALPGISGELLLDLALAPFVKVALCDAAGVAQWTLALPNDVTLAGLPGAVQALYVLPQGLGFGTTLARPLLY
jgi:hypothetical protein